MITVDANASARIDLMRILLISGIVFVHIPFDPQTSPYLGQHGLIDWLRVFLADSLFRVGVPCLSAISGYLLFRKGLDAFDYGNTVRRKAVTVVLPFLLWNGAFVLVVYAVQSQGLGVGYLPDLSSASFGELLNLFLAAGDQPLNLPLYFLRDLFACILVSPLLAILLRRWPYPTLSVLLVLAVLPIPLGLVLRNSILFSFSVGTWLALHKVDLKGLDRYAVPIAALFLAAAALLATGLYFTGPDFPLWLDLARNLMIIFGIPGFWAISAILIRSRAGLRLSRAGSLSFWIFCGHYPVLLLLWMLWNRTDANPYMLFYAAAAVITFAVLIVSNALTKRTMPRLYSVLTGSRTPPTGTGTSTGMRSHSPAAPLRGGEKSKFKQPEFKHQG